MNERRWLGRLELALATLVLLVSSQLVAEPPQTLEPIQRRLVFQGTAREYVVYLPSGFSRDASYWPLVVVGGGFLPRTIAQRVAESGFAAVVISSPGPADDINATRFPPLGEGAFVEAVLKQMRSEYRLKPKMLLAGYSRGAQFAHRFALAQPEQVEAVAPLASGTWTTPDGRLLVEELGEIPHARTFLSNAANASKIPARLKDMFDPKVAAVADARAAAGAEKVPFLVMCGTLDPRLPIAKEFVRSLETLGFRVTVEWPRTPHVCNPNDAACQAEFSGEFQKYSRSAVDFFQRAVKGQ